MKKKNKTIKIGDKIHYTFKQKTPYSNSGEVVHKSSYGGQKTFEVKIKTGIEVVFLDEVTAVN